MEEIREIKFIDTDGESDRIFGYTKKECLEKIGGKLVESNIYAVVVKTKEDGDYILDSTIGCRIIKGGNGDIGWRGNLIIDLYKNDKIIKTLYRGDIDRINTKDIGFSGNIIDHDSLTEDRYKLYFHSSSGNSANEPTVWYKVGPYNGEETFDGGNIYNGNGWIYIDNNYYPYGVLSIIISNTLI